jgi:SPX domain protein involved in polyphosphate accumulation
MVFLACKALSQASSHPEPLDGTLTSRYECKYLVSRMDAERIRRFIAPFMILDPYSVKQADRRYPVYSIYLDSQRLTTYEDTIQGTRNRFKLRLRYYSEHDLKSPVFFEVKKRSDQVINKSREASDRESAQEFLRHGHHEKAAEFIGHCERIGAMPAMRIRYMREAYECSGHAPVRLTFDTDLHHCIVSDFDLAESRPNWKPTPMEGVIVEIKFTERKPLWLDELVHVFELNKQSVAKYVRSIDCVADRGAMPALQAKLSTSSAWRFTPAD